MPSEISMNVPLNKYDKMTEQIARKMKTMKFFLIGMVIIGCQQQSVNSYTQKIKDHRKTVNNKFSNPEKSPLETSDLESFLGLNYFSIDSTFKVKASFTRTPDAEPFEMTTSTDRLPIYVEYGFATFSLENTSCTLHLYQSLDHLTNDDGEPYLFIPFGDNTSANETYGGGRFLDIPIPPDETVILDFNKSYNPYCAYNHKYSCPIPPKENLLSVSIFAGEKIFKEH